MAHWPLLNLSRLTRVDSEVVARDVVELLSSSGALLALYNIVDFTDALLVAL